MKKKKISVKLLPRFRDNKYFCESKLLARPTLESKYFDTNVEKYVCRCNALFNLIYIKICRRVSILYTFLLKSQIFIV